MISTTDLTAAQLEQLAALLADTTPGGGVYRPPAARDVWILRDLEHANLCRFTVDCGYEITDAGRDLVVGNAMDAADSEAFVRCASRHELREAIRNLKAVFNDLTDPALREQTLMDIEACQNRLDDLAAGRSESTGRHRVVPADDRPTEHLPRVQEQTAPMPSVGTLPGGERDQPDEPDHESAMLMLAALKATPSAAELAELAAVSTAGWQALAADLADERSWWRRKLTPRRVLVLSVIATVVVTWFVAWLVMG